MTLSKLRTYCDVTKQEAVEQENILNINNKWYMRMHYDS